MSLQQFLKIRKLQKLSTFMAWMQGRIEQKCSNSFVSNADKQAVKLEDSSVVFMENTVNNGTTQIDSDAVISSFFNVLACFIKAE